MKMKAKKYTICDNNSSSARGHLWGTQHLYQERRKVTIQSLKLLSSTLETSEREKLETGTRKKIAEIIEQKNIEK